MTNRRELAMELFRADDQFGDELSLTTAKRVDMKMKLSNRINFK
jgi:hypothetical protein